ncbi:hypothetical protein Hanom_Chr13g01214521 [Helianthus anomalus]
MEIYMVLSGGLGIGRVSLNPILVPDYFLFFKLVPDSYPLDFGYTRLVCFRYTRQYSFAIPKHIIRIVRNQSS